MENFDTNGDFHPKSSFHRFSCASSLARQAQKDELGVEIKLVALVETSNGRAECGAKNPI
jgi:hypothetical protein